jgi:hypothetical protein
MFLQLHDGPEMPYGLKNILSQNIQGSSCLFLQLKIHTLQALQ